jgi:methylthioribose-1-phosphate isomerase
MSDVPCSLEWLGDGLRVLDQRALPRRVVHLWCASWAAVVEAIRALAVRGAPAIGLAGAYAVALAAAEHRVPGASFEAAVEAIGSARPTAADLGAAVAEAARAARSAAASGGDPAAAAACCARNMHRRDAERCARIAGFGADLVPEGWVLTHCHTGSLATGGQGTALGAIALGYARGRIRGVFACETRPLWQGARLTAWECLQLGIPCRVVVDGAAGGLLAQGLVAAVCVGADRIASNGDTANKVGTYPISVVARRHGIPFFVLAPRSSIDPAISDGGWIPIEERDAREVLAPEAPEGVGAYNPAFDVTPGELVSAIVTDEGVFRPPYAFGTVSGRWAPSST